MINVEGFSDYENSRSTAGPLRNAFCARVAHAVFNSSAEPPDGSGTLGVWAARGRYQAGAPYLRSLQK